MSGGTRFEVVAEWFERARKLGPDARTRWLEEHRAADPELCEEVESLLLQTDLNPDFLEQAPSPTVSEAVHRLSLLRDPRVGRSIDAFVVDGVVAAGGMGTVYRAHDPEQPDRPIALKIVHPGTDSEEILERFHRESELLATLEHPNIARFLENGLTPEGDPFYAMEFIDGERITDACDLARMTIEERLALFCQVCDAVQYAHDCRVVHRDLKPGNILVDEDGTPHLIDFGIAKILEDKNADPTTAPFATRLLTPEYASPEQVRGGPATPVSDVYSLGVVLYEILTSQTPYSFASYHPTEILSVVSDPFVEPPSRRIGYDEADQKNAERRQLTLSKLRRRLAGDLDNIVLYAMRREPERRYASVAHFANDIRRHLRGKPVLARPDTTWYRLSRFCERHRVGVLASVLIVLALVAGTITTVYQARVAAEQADIAKEQARATQRILQLVLDLFDGDGFGPRPKLSAREFLDRAAKRLQRYRDLDPSIQAHVHEALGRMYHYTMAYDRAVDIYERAIQLRRQSLAIGGTDHEELLQCESKLGAAHYRAGRSKRALEILAAAHASATLQGFKNIGSNIATTIASIHKDRGEHRKAVEYGEECLRLRRELYGPEHTKTAAAMNNVATGYWNVGDLDHAEKLLRGAIAIHQKTNPDSSSEAHALHNLGLLLIHRKQPTAARGYLDRALALRLKELGPDHDQVAMTSYVIAQIAAARSDFAAAATAYRRVADIQEKNRPGHWHADDTRSRLGECLLELGKVEEARKLLEESARAMREKAGPTHEHTIEALARVKKLDRRPGVRK